MAKIYTLTISSEDGELFRKLALEEMDDEMKADTINSMLETLLDKSRPFDEMDFLDAYSNSGHPDEYFKMLEAQVGRKLTQKEKEDAHNHYQELNYKYGEDLTNVPDEPYEEQHNK